MVQRTMRGLNKPIQEANYKSKKKKKKQQHQFFLNSVPVAIMYERVTPFNGRGEEEEEVKAQRWIW